MKRKIYRAGFLFFLFLIATNRIYSQIQQHTSDQIQKLLSEKLSRNPAQRKISSQLLQAIRESQGRQMAEGVKLAPSPFRIGVSGTIQIDIKANVTNELLQRIKSLGGRIISSFPNFHSVRVEIKTNVIEAIGAYPEVKSIRPADKGFTVAAAHGSRMDEKYEVNHLKKTESYLRDLLIGSVTTEGDVTHGANDARTTFGYQGQGVKIGVLSTSFNHSGNEEKDIESGDLPGANNPFGNTTPVTVLEDADDDDEGRGMLEIVHDIAPKAQLFFATGDNGEADYANNILTLRNTYHCDIILDDEFYVYEPVYQDGIIAQAVNSVTASGAIYFSSAGNFGSVAKNDPGSWEGDFNDAGSPVFQGSTKLGTVHNFGNLAMPEGGDTILYGSSYKFYTLNWSDPLGGSNNDYDLFMLDKFGNVVNSATDIQDGTEDPSELIYTFTGTNFTGYQLVVFKAANAQVRAFSLNTLGGVLKHGTIGETHGHSNCAATISIAATNIGSVFPSRFNSSSQVEDFSSEGPRRMFFNADTTAVTPGNFLFSTNGGTVLNKPDLTAADGVSTNWLTPYFGTSAATPHAGAIAALLLSAKPSLTAQQIKSILISTALDIEAPGYDINSGFGIIQAFQAVQSLNPAVLPILSLGNVTETEGSKSNHNGTVDAGETGNLIVQLNINQTNNPNAIPVHVVLSTSTPGVNILQATADYNIVPGSSDVNTNNPFIIALDPAIICGTVIKFTLSSNLSDGGSGFQNVEFTEVVGPGTCPPVCISPLTLLVSGGYLPSPVPGIRYSQIFSATGGSNSGHYTFTLNGNLPGGIYFNGDSLYGLVTEAGNFSFNIVVNDPGGCSIYNYFNFSIAGTTPSSLKTTGGESQSTKIGSAFPNAFQVKVFNGKNILPGVNVTFTAPVNPVQGTFADGSTIVRIATDNTGTATAPSFIAQGTPGSYIVTASVNNLTPVDFNLKNNCIPTVVTTNADNGPGSLRYIIANACPGSKITFASGISEINLTGGEIVISKSLTVKGPGANLLTISGNNISRIFNISPNSIDSVLLTGITISNGLVPASSPGGGGGIIIYQGTVTIENCLISNNNAITAEFSNGGGIDIENGTVFILGSSILQNTAGFGGGISVMNQGFLEIFNSTIANNSLQMSDGIGNGGGLYSISPNGVTFLINCTVYGNSANNGGNIYADATNFYTTNSIIAGGVVSSSGVGPDIWGNIYSLGYNLVQNITGGNFYNANGDTVSVNPNLFPLGNYGGNFLTFLPQPNSPALDAGYTPYAYSNNDERGNKRVVNGLVDMGAVETNYKSTALAGTPQSSPVNTRFLTTLQGKVTESGNPIAGVNMMFTAPSQGASGFFNGNLTFVSVLTDLNGIGTAPDFTANNTKGNYIVFDSIGNSFAKTKFNLSNIKSALPTLSTALDKNELGNGLLLAYPNPTHDNLTILLPTTNKLMVHILDANGQIVHGSSVSTGRLDLNISTWASGVYIISVSDGVNINSLKFVKD